MSKFDTVVAPLTPSFNSPVGIVRISGPSSVEISSIITGKILIPRYATFCTFKTLDKFEFDRGIAIYFKSPNSFTGEDVVEFQCHGGLGVIDLLIESCLNFKASFGTTRLAAPGEFSKRAFLNNRINLIEAEAIADIICASSTDAVKAINNSLSGKFGSLIRDLSNDVLVVRADLEAKIDFVEDNLGVLEISTILKNVNLIRCSILSCLNFAENGKKISLVPKVALVGPTNVGKSSILNYFSNNDSAIVSDSKGTTRDVIREIIRIDDQLSIQVSDTAGIRDTSESVEAEGVKRSWSEIEAANCLIFISDYSSDSLDQDLILRDEVLNKIKDKNKLLITVFNKVDKIPKSELKSKPKSIKGECFFVSAKSGEGLLELKQKLKSLFSKQDLINHTECLIISKRIEVDLKESLFHINNSLENIKLKQFDLCAEDLKQAHFSIKRIEGREVSDDLLDKIFSSFCIGK